LQDVIRPEAHSFWTSRRRAPLSAFATIKRFAANVIYYVLNGASLMTIWLRPAHFRARAIIRSQRIKTWLRSATGDRLSAVETPHGALELRVRLLESSGSRDLGSNRPKCGAEFTTK
jgi:hypothetical protein